MSYYSYRSHDPDIAFERALDRMISRWENMEPPYEEQEKPLDPDEDYNYFETNEESDGNLIPQKT